MSDDDGRMDRARRIRELREGNRRSATDETDGTAANENRSTTDETGDDGSANADVADHVDDSDADHVDDSAANGPEDGTGPTDDEEADDSDDGQVAGGLDVADGSGDQTGDDDAVAAAQAAAAAVSEFEGEGGVTMDAMGADSTETVPAGATVADADVTTAEEETRVLEFRLGDELYCLDIEYVEEIVREETVTRVPNTPAYVSGVVDLRGQITTILDPKVAVGMERTDDDQLIVVFNADLFDDHGAMGWLVDEVNQVTPVRESEVKESPIQEAYINGVIERDDEFVIWTTPDLALDVDDEA